MLTCETRASIKGRRGVAHFQRAQDDGRTAMRSSVSLAATVPSTTSRSHVGAVATFLHSLEVHASARRSRKFVKCSSTSDAVLSSMSKEYFFVTIYPYKSKVAMGGGGLRGVASAAVSSSGVFSCSVIVALSSPAAAAAAALQGVQGGECFIVAVAAKEA